MQTGTDLADEEEYDYISEKISSFIQEITEKAPLVETVQNAILEKNQLSND